MLNIDWGASLEFVLALVIISGLAWVLSWYTQYWRPRVLAYRTGANRVTIWFGSGELILWNPGQSFAFLRNKQIAKIGDRQGGIRAIYAYRGEEAIGPIQLQSALFDWEDQSVLTRDGQVLSIKIGAWWRVLNVEKYVFEIYAETRGGTGIRPGATGLGGSRNAAFDSVQVHQIADRWLRVITESTIRTKVNSLTVADVVSAQAMQFLQYSAEGRLSAKDSATGTFEAAILSVLGDVQDKAREFGLEVERLEVQHVQLPKEIQDAINETRVAFLAPIRSEREAEAQRITLEKLISVLGKDTVGLNEIMKNLQNANFVAPMNFLQPVFDSAMKKSEEPRKKSEGPDLALPG